MNAREPLIAHRIMILHGRVAYLAGLALNVEGCDKIAIELNEIRRELNDIFELLHPKTSHKK